MGWVEEQLLRPREPPASELSNTTTQQKTNTFNSFWKRQTLSILEQNIIMICSMGVLQHVHAVMQLQANIHLIISSRVLCHLCKEAFRNYPRRTIMSFFRCPLSRIIAPGRPKRLMAGWKFHLAQLTKSFPTDFNYLGPRWNGPLLGAGVNATKYQKPWPRTDIIVRWPHDCLSPIMRWPQERPVQTVWGIGASYFGFPWKIGILSHSGGGVNSFRHCC